MPPGNVKPSCMIASVSLQSKSHTIRQSVVAKVEIFAICSVEHFDTTLLKRRDSRPPQPYVGFSTMPHSTRRPATTQDTAELIRYALRGIEHLFREGYRYQKAGVILTALVPASQVQTHLFDRQDRERSRKLMAAIDTINKEWGAGTIRYAAVGLRPDWIMRCARRSPRYTTRWEELAVVR